MQNILFLIYSLILLVIVTGCSAHLTQVRREVSSGIIGCHPQELVIKDEADRSWTVVCKGKVYYCGVIGGEYEPVKCSEAR